MGQRERPQIEPISSGVTRSKGRIGSISSKQSRSVDSLSQVQGTPTISSIGGGPIKRTQVRGRPLRVSDL